MYMQTYTFILNTYFPRFRISISQGSWVIPLDKLYIRVFQKRNLQIQAFFHLSPGPFHRIGPTFRM